MKINDIDELYKIAKEVRKDVITMAYKASSSHVGSCLSIADIMVVLYHRILNINNNNISDGTRDKFILSKGHSSSMLYAVLASKGFIDKEILETYCMDGSHLSGHPKMKALPGIEVSSGSLGHGLGLGCGIALGDKAVGRDSKCVVLMGDGECEEGSVWEAAMFASSRKLNNLIAVIDNNELQGLGRVKEVTGLYSLKEKWKSFNWNVIEINGHDYQEIFDAFNKAYEFSDRPTVIIAHTVKGKGVSFMEDRLEWHYKSPDLQQYNLAIEEVE